MSNFSQHQKDLNWFLMIGITLLFGLYRMFTLPDAQMLAFTSLAFMLFLHAMIRMEMHDIESEKTH